MLADVILPFITTSPSPRAPVFMRCKYTKLASSMDGKINRKFCLFIHLRRALVVFNLCRTIYTALFCGFCSCGFRETFKGNNLLGCGQCPKSLWPHPPLYLSTFGDIIWFGSICPQDFCILSYPQTLLDIVCIWADVSGWRLPLVSYKQHEMFWVTLVSTYGLHFD